MVLKMHAFELLDLLQNLLTWTFAEKNSLEEVC